MKSLQFITDDFVLLTTFKAKIVISLDKAMKGLNYLTNRVELLILQLNGATVFNSNQLINVKE